MNKFKNLSSALKGEEVELEPDNSTLKETREQVEVKKSKRATGKRSHPDYLQVGVYIPKHLHLAVKKKLLEQPDIDMSSLVEKLLQEWIES